MMPILPLLPISVILFSYNLLLRFVSTPPPRHEKSAAKNGGVADEWGCDFTVCLVIWKSRDIKLTFDSLETNDPHQEHRHAGRQC